MEIKYRNDLILENEDLPRRLYFSRFKHQWVGDILDKDECVSVGNLELVKSSRQWNGDGEFRHYAIKAIIHAVHLEANREIRRSHSPLTSDPFYHDQFNKTEDEELVVMVMSRMSHQNQRLLTDRIVNDMTFQQMGDARGISKTNVQKWYAFAFEKAKQIALLLTKFDCL